MPPSAGWALRSRLRRAVGRSDGWSVLRWGEFRTGSVQDALGARVLQKKDLASSGQSELTSCERRACLLPWQLMPITAWTNQTHPSTWTRWRASGGFVCSIFTCRHEFQRWAKEKQRQRKKMCMKKQRYFLQDVCELFRMISSYKFWPLKMIRKKYKSLKTYSFKELWHSQKINHDSTEIKLIKSTKNLKIKCNQMPCVILVLFTYSSFP